MGKIAVMGAGSWGTAFAMVCCDAGEDVQLWARRESVAQEIHTQHRNSAYLGEVELPSTLRATADPLEALHAAEVVVVGVPSHALRRCLLDWRAAAPRDAIYVSLIKGVELDTRQRASEVIREVLDLPYDRVAVLSGPNLAGECARRLPSASVAASSEAAVTKRIQTMSHTGYFRVYTNPDTVGVEVGGAVKNPLALAAGIADGMGFGDNTKAMLITRGLAEMSRLGVAHGGNPLTFSGLAGMGDLVVTCTSTQSRNRYVGEQLGKGRSLEEIVNAMSMVAEGVRSSKALAGLARDHGVEMPIVEHVVKVVHEGLDVADMVRSLMGREPKPEFHGLGEASP